MDSTAGRGALEKIQIFCAYQDSIPGPSSRYPSHQASSTEERRVQNVLLREFYGNIPPALPCPTGDPNDPAVWFVQLCCWTSHWNTGETVLATVRSGPGTLRSCANSNIGNWIWRRQRQTDRQTDRLPDSLHGAEAFYRS